MSLIDEPAHQIWPEFQSIINKDLASGHAGLEQLPVAQARRLMTTALVRWGGPRPAGLRVDDLVLPAGEHQVTVRLYHAEGPDSKPLVIFVHGGGFILGDVETHDSMAARLARSAAVAVASIDYVRAPEASPGEIVQQCLGAVTSLRAWATGQTWWSGALGVAGDSAGATLAWLTTIAIGAQERQARAIDGLLLLYPPLDPACDTYSWESMPTRHFLARSTMRWFWRQFLSGGEIPAGLDLMDPPALLPRVDLVVGSRDPLLDECLVLGRRLRDRHPRSQTLVVPGAIHGFAGMPAISPRAAALTDDLFAAFGHRLALAEHAGRLNITHFNPEGPFEGASDRTTVKDTQWTASTGTE